MNYQSFHTASVSSVNVPFHRVVVIVNDMFFCVACFITCTRKTTASSRQNQEMTQVLTVEEEQSRGLCLVAYTNGLMINAAASGLTVHPA